MRIRTCSIAVLAVLLALLSSHPELTARQMVKGDPITRPGQTATQLADGRWLVVGGYEPRSTYIADPVTGARQAVAPLQTRLWHTASVLPDGTVMIIGGVDQSGVPLALAEIFNPRTGQYSAVEGNLSLTPRAYHTATVLTDGRVLIVGGDAPGGSTAEIWNPSTRSAHSAGAVMTPRRRHRAELQPDGSVRIDLGTDASGREVSDAESFDPQSNTFVAFGVGTGDDVLGLTGSLPVNGAVNVDPATRIALRFGRVLDLASVRSAEISLESDGARADADIVAAEGGRLVFIAPSAPFRAGANVTLTLDGLRSRGGDGLDRLTLSFVVADLHQPPLPFTPTDTHIWTPRDAGWRSNQEASSWKQLDPLRAPEGVTALAGQVLRLDGQPLSDVTLDVEGRRVRSDRTGRFLLALDTLPGGWHELVIEGKTANRAGQKFGRFEYGLTIVKGRTNILPFTIWMPVLDTANAVRIDSPTQAETVITTPHIPGLELHLPAGTTITDEEGKTVKEISITPIPVNRTPFPLPNGVQVPIYFTIQPGGAYVHIRSDSTTYVRGAWLVYPNYTARPAGERLPFWLYDPEQNGWHVYGHGNVTPEGRQVRPERGTYLYEFTGAMIGVERDPPSDPPGDGERGGDPVDLATGLFIMEKTDLFLPDVIPLALTRTYRNNDDGVRPFGVGMQHPYDMWFDNQVVFQEADLILPDATRIHYVRTSPGTGATDAVYEHTTTPTAFYGSRVTYNGNGWDLTLRDGTVFVFGIEAPLQSIRDRFGNTVTISRSGGPLGNIAKITSPHGRYIEFTYDTSNRITQAKDSLGRTVTYTYNTAGCLSSVTDAKGGVTEYTYDGAHRMLTIEDARNIVYLTNEYDTAGRVIQQTMADGGEYTFDYTLNGSGQITQTDLTNPRGYVRRVAFNSARYMTSNTQALGQTMEQTTSYSRLSGSHLIDTVTDELNRITKFQYDAKGNLASVTKLYGTADAKTTSFTYDSTYSLVTSVTDPLNHTRSAAFDSLGRPVSVTNALNHTTTFGTNAAGQIASITTPLNHQTTLGYDLGDLAGVQTPLGNTWNQFMDAGGRVIKSVDVNGRATMVEYDALNQVTKVTDPLAGETTFSYDANGNLLTLTDARGKTTTWTYNNMDRVATRTDPLSRQESFTYDLNGNLKTSTDRKGQLTTYNYDALDRQTFLGFDTTGTPATYESTIAITYDQANRVTQITDSSAGTLTRAYNGSDAVVEETSPHGTVTYSYDEAGRRATMEVAGQSEVSYTYDDANRLTAISQGTAVVSMAYDSGGRRTSVTVPNGVVTEYTYDNDSRPTALVYKHGNTTIGSVAYSYEANGSLATAAGSMARVVLPPSVTSATYDDANQLATWGAASFSFDSNGNMLSDGSKSYTWNARNELTAISGASSAGFVYDAFGRRRTRVAGSTTTDFLYDGHNLVQELASGTPTANLLTGLAVDENFLRSDASTTRYLLRDALGSTAALTDATGAVQTEYTYEPFGAVTTTGSLTSNTVAFAGREADGTGLMFMRARYYDPKYHRFLNEDPIGFGGGVNVFAYAGNDPVMRRDPLGLKPKGPESDCEAYVNDLVEDMSRGGSWLANLGCYYADSIGMFFTGFYDALIAKTKNRGASGFKDVWVEPYQTNDIYNHLNVIVGAEAFRGVGGRGVTDLMMALDVRDIQKNRPWGHQELLNDILAQVIARLREHAAWTGDYAKLRENLLKLLCQ